MQSLVWSALVLAALGLAGIVAWRIDGRGRWLPALRARFLYGVPWGTLCSIAFVLAVYLFVQDGISDWHDPVVLPFRAWSYLYPTGMLTAGFSHASESHLIGNLIGTVVVGPIAEYAWGHYPPESTGGADDGSDAEDRGSALGPDWLRTALQTPWIRAVVIFPGMTLALGLFTAIFAVGPVIGFSGVVFAFGGFALVRYPIPTLVALLAQSAVSRTYWTLLDPVVYGEITSTPPSGPWWADVAVQAHAVGVLVGVALGLGLLWLRDERPDAGAVLLAIFVYASSQSLWAIYWFEGDGVYVLYRGLGTALVALLALIVTVAAAARDRPLAATLGGIPGDPTPRQFAIGWIGGVAFAVLGGLAAIAVVGGPVVAASVLAGAIGLLLALPAMFVLLPLEWEGPPVTSKQVAVTIVVLATVLLAGAAIPSNLVTVDDDPVPNEEALSVSGYEVTYAEDVRDQRIPAIDLPGAENRTNVTVSGIVVVDTDRHLWTTALSRQYLASEGTATVDVGGLGWRETVVAERSGWAVVGNDTVYDVELRHGGESIRPFASEPLRASPVLANHTVAIEPNGSRFGLRVFHDNSTVGTASIPAVNNSTAIGPLTFRTDREEDRLTVQAAVDGTQVTVARRETYREE